MIKKRSQPDADLLARCREHGMPPLAPTGWRRDPVWRTLVIPLVDALEDIVPAPARAAFARRGSPEAGSTI